MPTPTGNQTAATAFDLTPYLQAFPFQTLATEDVSPLVGPNYDVWFKYSPGVGEVSFGLLAYALSGPNYRPTMTVWTDPASAPVAYYPGTLVAGHDTPMQVPITASIPTYYIRVRADAFSVLPFTDLQLLVSRMPGDVGDPGSIIIPDDSGNVWPATVLSSADGTVLQMRGTVNGEEGAMLDSGIFAIINDDDSPTVPLAVVIYSSQVVELVRVSPFPNEAGTEAIGTDAVHTFYASHRKTGDPFSTIKTVSDAGVVGGTSWVINPAVITALAPDRANAKLYYADGGANHGLGGTVNRAVKVWDLVNDVALADLVGGVANHYLGPDLFVMHDGNILVLYVDDATPDIFARLYSPAGAVIRTFTYTPIDPVLTVVPRMALGNDDPDSFWIWGTGPDGFGSFISRFVHYKTSDGSVLATFDRPVAENSIGASGAGNDGTLPLFAQSFSCPFLILRQTLASPYEGPSLTDVTNMNCVRPGLQILTLTGTNFVDGVTVIVTDPQGNVLDDVSTTLVSGVQLTIQFTAESFGEYCFKVQNPDGQKTETFCTTAQCEETTTMRRLRRTTHLSKENLWNFYKSVTLDYEPGTGLTAGLGSDPSLMLRWSDDGGHDWSDWHTIKIGKIGEYKHRAIWRRLGRSRNRIFEVVSSDPEKIVLIDGFIEFDEGIS